MKGESVQFPEQEAVFLKTKSCIVSRLWRESRLRKGPAHDAQRRNRNGGNYRGLEHQAGSKNILKAMTCNDIAH